VVIFVFKKSTLKSLLKEVITPLFTRIENKMEEALAKLSGLVLTQGEAIVAELAQVKAALEAATPDTSAALAKISEISAAIESNTSAIKGIIPDTVTPVDPETGEEVAL
jgi:hypothetical protein